MHKKTTMFVLTLLTLLVTIPVLSACEIFDDDYHHGGRHRDGGGQHDGGGRHDSRDH